MSNHVFITGKPGVGKTTIIKKIISEIKSIKPNWTIAGFYTEEIRQNGQRIGFKIHALNGQSGVLASLSNSEYKTDNCVGKYSVDTIELDKIAVPQLYKRMDLIIIDELGKMELISQRFRNAVIFLFKSRSRILGTLPLYENPFLRNLKDNFEMKIFNLTRSNRKELFYEIVPVLTNGVL